jgi:glycosyltransferase involved in cell wall biosynthesis
LVISVIIPTFNRAHTLDRALESVLTQRRPPDEVIVVDDGSEDGTAAMVRSRYPQVRLLEQINRGVSAARNLGIAQAMGEWLAFLDSDDAWLPGKLEAQLALVDTIPGRRLCHTEEIWIRNGVRVNAMGKHRKRGGNIFRDCLPRCVISPSSVLMQRSLLDEVGGFDEDLPACEDYDLWLRICAREEVQFVDTPQTVKHGGHEDQLSRKHWGMDRFRVYALEKLLRETELQPEFDAAAASMLATKAGILAQGAEKRGNEDMARKYRSRQRQYGDAVATPEAEASGSQ